MGKKARKNAVKSAAETTNRTVSQAGKGRATPKRNTNRKTDRAAKIKSANVQWFIIAAALVLIIGAIIVLGTIFGEPYDPLEYLEADAIRRQEALRGG